MDGLVVAVTGGTGFIGRALVSRLLAEGASVRLLSRRSGHPPRERVQVVQADLADDAADLVPFVDGVDVLYHCAAELNDESAMQAVHVDGTRRLLAASRARVGRWVQLSSVGVYGPRRAGVVTETDDERPGGPYEKTKAAADALVRASAEDFVVVQPSNVFGAGMSTWSLRQWVETVDRGLFMFVGSAGASANYVHVRNVVEALVLCGVEPTASGQTYIVSDRLDMEEFVGTIATALGRRPPRVHLPLWLARSAASLGSLVPGFPLTRSRVDALSSRALYSSVKIETQLGYRNVVSVPEGVLEVVAEYRSEAAGGSCSHRTAVPSRVPLLVHVATVPWTLRFFRGQAGYLRSRGIEVRAVSSPDPAESLAEFSKSEGVPVYPLQMKREIAPLSDLLVLVRLWRLLRRLRPDVVHSHSPKTALIGTLAARLARVPCVVISIFGLVQMSRSGPGATVLNRVTRLQCRLANRVWCDSASMRDHLVESGLCDVDKITVIGSGSVNGVDAEVFSPSRGAAHREEVRNALGIAGSDRVVGFVGRITVDKGIRELAEAWSTLRVQLPDGHLLLVGPVEEGARRPPELDVLLADGRVHLVGEIADVSPYLAAMDVFAMPSYREGFGIANIEAAAMELPVVATRIPGCTDSVADGVTGTLIPARDGAALAAALRRYLDDEQLRRAHGRAGRQRVLEEYRPEAVWAGLYEMYRGLLASRGLLP